MDSKDFINAYESILFSAEENDPFSSASVQRKCLALNFFGSIELGHDNFTTSYLLSKDLEEYRKIVDNQDKDCVNSYADLTLALLPQNRCDNQKQWKTGLQDLDMFDFVKPPPCQTDSKKLCCKNSVFTKANIEELVNAKLNYTPPLESETKPTFNFSQTQTQFKPNSTTSKIVQNDLKFSSSSHNDNNTSRNNTHNNFKFSGISEIKLPRDKQSESRYCQPRQVQSESRYGQSREVQSESRFTCPREVQNESRFVQQRAANNYQRNSGFFADRSELGNKRNVIDQMNSFDRFRGTNQGRNNDNGQNYFNDRDKQDPYEKVKDEDDSRFKGNFFKTARDLHVENSKKPGKSGGSYSNEGNYNYGVVKKSLGARKGGVFNKFTPPVRKDESEQGGRETMEFSEEPVDERLKNIDPKMIELIKNEIMDSGSAITWNDIAGLELAKTTIQEIVVYPMLRPDIFTGLRRPPKGILLFGPPGTGKTLIGKCIASQSNSTFFSISASSLTSKWVGDGEKMVRALFAVAKCHQPAVVFIDEIDSLLSQRSDSEHESSRRIKTEFLVQLDGAGTGDDERILIIGATNRPQELDEAARRRLVKRLYIPLPDEMARKQIIDNLISTERHCLTEDDIDEIAKLSKGYSGADVKNLCQEASLGPIRSIPPMQIREIRPEQVRPLNASDFMSALTRIKSSVSEGDLDTYIAWDRQYGCGSAMH